ncbi:DNA_pol_E_B-domain-containing protein [Sphaerulina musiva SO2202]|uniref:DNA polymerase epsilon subunit B n=1 Tax=Sphaerulina musiva (strain SO2202) TaxID=692275 RepID=M3D3M8_SPHMS|nr:DNA_pol_E_B-domain-containing protein [Sphaerulina musiva SO2202]EMF12825.1 DNA_pol_E_B-domain-containing protein [Sphaerulina musiva SO2202]
MNMARPTTSAQNPFSSSPAFGTPVHPFPPTAGKRPPPAPPAFKPQIATILPILLPPATLRPVAFRTFTKKYSLTLNSSALQAFASFIGKHCGSAWREEGTGEKLLEEAAKLWKAENGPVIVEDGEKLKTILRTLEGSMSSGRVGTPRSGNSLNPSRQNSFAFGNDSAVDILGDRPELERQGSSYGISGLRVQSPASGPEEEDHGSSEPRKWLKVISAFEQPRFTFDMDKKHFLRVEIKPTLFPNPRQKTAVFKERYNIIHQRLLRNPAFQAPSISAGVPTLKRHGTVTERTFYKITPIANLLGRGGSSHLLLGMLAIAPTGTLALNDMSGSISLDLQHATSMQDGQPYFCPGMIVLVDGVYEEDWAGAGSSGLGNTGGVGGTIGGRFVGFEIGSPPVERRDISLGINLKAEDLGGGFGWADFLGLGSERAVGTRMKKLESRLVGPESDIDDDARKMVILSGVTLDQPSTLTALRKLLEQYEAAEQLPMGFVLAGDFSSKAAMAGAGTGSIEYKELFNELAAVLSDFPALLRSCTWVFMPGDNDPWASSFSAGASTLLPREGVPDLFTNRIKRAFANAKAEVGAKKGEADGEAIWTSNPTRLSFFGPAHELVILRDDISGRFRRNAIRYGQATKQAESQTDSAIVLPDSDEDMTMSGALPTTESDELEDTRMAFDADSPPAALAETVPSESYNIQEAKRLILSLLPQSTVSPFPLTVRPVHWDYAPSALTLYPLPHALVVADADAPPFAITYEGCHVMNPGRLVEGGGKRKKVQWIEYDVWTKRGGVKELWMG